MEEKFKLKINFIFCITTKKVAKLSCFYGLGSKLIELFYWRESQLSTFMSG